MKKVLLYLGLAYLGYKLFYSEETVVIIDENTVTPDPRTPGTQYTQLPGGNFQPITTQPNTNN